jgi:hypothetical protein
LSGVGEEEGPAENGKHFLHCVFCKNKITSAEERIPVNDQHQHRLTNQAGERFKVGCFAQAAGCRGLGVGTLEHTWFAGFKWKVAVCLFCGLQLGWYYKDTAGKSFYGLILNRLIER